VNASAGDEAQRIGKDGQMLFRDFHVSFLAESLGSAQANFWRPQRVIK
jgi:hypothetical protein